MSLQADPVNTDTRAELRAELAADEGGHLPALDGMRGLGVVFVMAYHHGFGWAKGGFLAVSMFFTLSGFLVTWLALREWGRSGGLSISKFLERRARRLLPAAVVTLILVMVFGVVAADAAQRDRLSWDLVASATYWANWRAYLSGNAYFDGFVESSPLEHFWSLSIEEQFYLIFPFVAVLVFACVRRGRRNLASGVWLVALASAIWTAVAYQLWGPERAYLGTDTRAAEILMGVGLACAITGRRALLDKWKRPLAVVAGIGAVVWITFMSSVPSDVAFVYRGGLALTGIATMAMVLAEVAGLSVLAPFRWAIPVWFGQRSYGIYLLHFPLFMWIDSDVTSATGWELFAIRLAVVIPSAAAMYVLVEQPIRTRRALPSIDFLRFVPGAIAVCVLAALVIPFPTFGPADLTSSRIALGASQDELSVPVPTTKVERRDRVLVISLGPGDPVKDELLQSPFDGPIDYLDGGDFWCDGEVRESCGPWWERWPHLVADKRVDAVLLLARDFDAAPDLLSQVGAPPDADRDWFSARLRDGVDALSASGTPVVAATLTKRNLMRTVELDLVPLEVAAIEGTFDVSIDTPELQTVELPDDETSASVANEAITARLDEQNLTVMVMGDSMGGGVAEGLQRWTETQTDLDEVAIWDSTRAGCGFFAMAYRDTDAGCEGLTQTLIDRLNAVKPDVVVVINSSSELVAQEVEGIRTRPGDALYDLGMISVYEQWLKRFRDIGAHVVWFNAPCMGDGAARMFSVDTTDISTFNTQVIPAFLERNEDVQFFDSESALCPDGQFTSELGGMANARPDGMHLSEDATVWFAQTYGPTILGLRRETPHRSTPGASGDRTGGGDASATNGSNSTIDNTVAHQSTGANKTGRGQR